MQRRRFVVLTLLGFLTGVGIFVVWPQFRAKRPRPVAELPRASEIAEIRASLLKVDDIGLSATPEFVVPEKYFASILVLLQPAAHEPGGIPRTWRFDQLGEVIIRDRSAQVFRIKFYWAGHNPVLFAINDTDFFWGNIPGGNADFFDGGISLCAAVRKASEEAVQIESLPK